MKALLAIDGSTELAFGVELAASLAWPSGAELQVLTVLPSETERIGGPWLAGVAYVPSDVTRDGLRTDGAALLEQAAAPLRELGLEVTTRLIEGRAASVIVDTARDIGADLVVLGARGHGAIEEAFLGSVSAEVVDQAPCAVLVARGPFAERILIGTDGSDVAMSAAQFVGGAGSSVTVTCESCMRSMSTRRGGWAMCRVMVHMRSTATPPSWRRATGVAAT